MIVTIIRTISVHLIKVNIVAIPAIHVSNIDHVCVTIPAIPVHIINMYVQKLYNHITFVINNPSTFDECLQTL